VNVADTDTEQLKQRWRNAIVYCDLPVGARYLLLAMVDHECTLKYGKRLYYCFDAWYDIGSAFNITPRDEAWYTIIDAAEQRIVRLGHYGPHFAVVFDADLLVDQSIEKLLAERQWRREYGVPALLPKPVHTLREDAF
jgi:hypothetical protein